MKYLVIFFLCFSLLGCVDAQESGYTRELDGTILHYAYSGGNEYQVKLEKQGASYQFRTGSKPDKWWGPFPYQALITDDGDYVISWFEKGYGDYVTLFVDFEKSYLIGSAIIPKKGVHFERASIKEFTIPKIQD